ncbi:MAG: hypothetical protein KF718_26500 [Polyangiaceae bacterium]|nr:hypothetical protein [Polyangiaceae bacterium]
MCTLRWATGLLMLACAQPRGPAAEDGSAHAPRGVGAAAGNAVAPDAEPPTRGQPGLEDTSWAPPEPSRAKLGVGQGFRCEIVKDTAACVATQLSFHCPGDQPPGPVLARVDSVVEVGAGERHACFVDRAGHVHCAGLNEAGGLGDGTRRGGERVHGRGGPLSALAREARARHRERVASPPWGRSRRAEDGQCPAIERPHARPRARRRLRARKR